VPPGLSTHSRRLLSYLPGIYHTDFMARFLGIFESILTPIEWNVDNFDLYLHPGTAPTGFMPWLANWFEIAFDPTWSEAQRRTLLAEAHQIYARRGTRWALSRVLEIYTGRKPEIIDLGEGQEPCTFTVKLPLRKRDANQELIAAITDANKPAHTTYTLEFKQ
jgi:phage tail-like protein